MKKLEKNNISVKNKKVIYQKNILNQYLLKYDQNEITLDKVQISLSKLHKFTPNKTKKLKTRKKEVLKRSIVMISFEKTYST